jgi:O-antigen/teichoic acid export membrane protein
MRRFFVKNLVFIIVINLLVKPAWIFLIDRTVQNRVGYAQYGIYQALFNLSLIFQIMLDFGITSYNSRTIAQNPNKLKTHFSNMLSARAILMVLYIAFVYIAAWSLGYRKWELLLLLGILLIQSFNTLVLFMRSNVAALLKFRLDGLLSVTDRLLMIIVCGALLLYPATGQHFKIEWFVMSQIGCYAASAIIGFLVLRSISPVTIHFSIDTKEILAIIKESLPYALLFFLMAIYMRADTMMIERLCGEQGKVQAGIYAAASRLLEVSNNMFGVMFAGVLLPLFGRMLSQKQNVQPIVRQAVNMLLPGSQLVAVASVFFKNDIMHRLYPSAQAYDGDVFAWLMCAFPAYCIMYVYSTLLTANGNLKLLNKQALVGVIINLSLNFYFIRHEQALGAAKVACITQFILAVASIYFTKEKIGLPLNIRWTLAHISYLLLCIIAAYSLSFLSVSWVLQLSLLGVVGIVLLFVFRFVSVSSFTLFMSKQNDATA